MIANSVDLYTSKMSGRQMRRLLKKKTATNQAKSKYFCLDYSTNFSTRYFYKNL